MAKNSTPLLLTLIPCLQSAFLQSSMLLRSEKSRAQWDPLMIYTISGGSRNLSSVLRRRRSVSPKEDVIFATPSIPEP